MLFSFSKEPGRDKKIELPIDQTFKEGGVEPRLEEVLADPVIQLRAQADKMAPEDLKIRIENLQNTVFHRQTLVS